MCPSGRWGPGNRGAGFKGVCFVMVCRLSYLGLYVHNRMSVLSDFEILNLLPPMRETLVSELTLLLHVHLKVGSQRL